MIDRARHHEEQIREPVDIPDQKLVNGWPQRDHPPLGTAADGARKVKRGARLGAARQDKVRQRSEVGLEPIDELLEALDIAILKDRLCDAGRNPVVRIGEPGAKRKQIALNLHDRTGDVRKRRAVGAGVQRRERQAEQGIHFVDLAVRIDTDVAFGDACAAEQRCLTGVAGACIDLHGVRDELSII